MEQVDNLNTEQLSSVLENYADLEVTILDERDGVDPEENGDGDENVEEEGVDENGGDEEEDTCTKCEKECILDFVFELRDVVGDNEKEILENIIVAIFPATLMQHPQSYLQVRVLIFSHGSSSLQYFY